MSRKDRAADRLLKAVANWVEVSGGKALVIGGIEVQDFHEGKFKFRVAVRCTGRRPKCVQDDGTPWETKYGCGGEKCGECEP